MSNGNGHHWSKFSWRDWSADKALHPCSLAAKGFWIEMLCIMHEGSPVGHLTLGGKPATVRQMAANAYCSEKEAAKHLAELEEAGVFSRTQDGTIYSRRMVKDAAASEAGREHIAKRWNGPKPAPPPNSPPIRGPNSKPNGEANSHPTSQAYRPPTSTPITKTQESETEPEREEKKEVYSNPLISPVLARVAAACETPPEGTYGAEPTNPATQIAVKNIVGKLGRKFDANANETVFAQGKRPKLTVIEQQAAVLRGPVIDDDTLVGELLQPLHRGPVDPQRTVAEQLAAIGFPHLVEARPP